jgi:hypothetical protein
MAVIEYSCILALLMNEGKGMSYIESVAPQ